MNLSRRSFLLGTSAAVAATALPEFSNNEIMSMARVPLLTAMSVDFEIENLRCDYAAMFGRALAATKETMAADILNRAFS